MDKYKVKSKLPEGWNIDEIELDQEPYSVIFKKDKPYSYISIDYFPDKKWNEVKLFIRNGAFETNTSEVYKIPFTNWNEGQKIALL